MSVASHEVKTASIEMGVVCRYDKFAFDITDALEKNVSGVHELAVRVFDPTGQRSWCIFSSTSLMLPYCC